MRDGDGDAHCTGTRVGLHWHHTHTQLARHFDRVQRDDGTHWCGNNGARMTLVDDPELLNLIRTGPESSSLSTNNTASALAHNRTLRKSGLIVCIRYSILGRCMWFPLSQLHPAGSCSSHVQYVSIYFLSPSYRQTTPVSCDFFPSPYIFLYSQDPTEQK